jgi:hypothetical protein
MFPVAGAALWQGRAKPQASSFALTVRAVTAKGEADEETISVAVSAEDVPVREIGVWSEKHIPATQLGPNKNGRK